MSDSIKDCLAERGYAVSIVRGSWLAYKTIAGAPDCESNEKPPQWVVEPWADGERYIISSTGCAGGQWYQVRAYHVLESELLAALPEIERRLAVAWEAVAGGWIVDRNPRDEELTPVEGIGSQPDRHGVFLICRYNGSVGIGTFTRDVDFAGNRLLGFWGDYDSGEATPARRRVVPLAARCRPRRLSASSTVSIAWPKTAG